MTVNIFNLISDLDLIDRLINLIIIGNSCLGVMMYFIRLLM